MSSLLENKYFWIGLIIYAIPGFIGFSIFSSRIGHPPANGLDALATLLFSIAISPIGIPVSLGDVQDVPPLNTPQWLSVLVVPYYVICYGLLYLYYRREKRKRESTSEQGIDPGFREANG